MESQPIVEFPAEWLPHEATWMTWPENVETWPNNLAEAQAEFENLVRAIAETEPVYLIASDKWLPLLQKKFASASPVRLIEIPTNDSWIRDYGPTMVKSREKAATHGVAWSYDGWGKKYPPFDLDQAAAAAILESLGLPCLRSPLVLEGGAIETNGQTLLTTLGCVAKRNPGWSLEQIERELRYRIGIRDVLFVDVDEIAGDDTDGHIDQAARFINEETLLISARQWETFPTDELANRFNLLELCDPLEEVRLFGSILPASYTNFYFANEVVLVPQFGDRHDPTALRSIAEHCPDREVIGLPSRHLSAGLGSFHCLTQQQPE